MFNAKKDHSLLLHGSKYPSVFQVPTIHFSIGMCQSDVPFFSRKSLDPNMTQRFCSQEASCRRVVTFLGFYTPVHAPKAANLCTSKIVCHCRRAMSLLLLARATRVACTIRRGLTLSWLSHACLSGTIPPCCYLSFHSSSLPSGQSRTPSWTREAKIVVRPSAHAKWGTATRLAPAQADVAVSSAPSVGQSQ